MTHKLSQSDAYRFIGIEKGQSFCENCGKRITYLVQIVNEGGGKFVVGSECVKTLIQPQGLVEQTIFNDTFKFLTFAATADEVRIVPAGHMLEAIKRDAKRAHITRRMYSISSLNGFDLSKILKTNEVTDNPWSNPQDEWLEFQQVEKEFEVWIGNNPPLEN